MESKAFDQLISYLQLFKNIPVKDRGIIREHVRFASVKEGEVLLAEGKTARELYFVCDGILKIVTINDSGKAVTQFFLKNNQFCTILDSLTHNRPSQENIIAACDTQLIVFTREQLHALYGIIPYFKGLIGDITQQGLLDKIQLRHALMGEDATARYKKFLLRQPEIALRVSLSDIASYLGITQQSLSRIRKQLR